MIESIFRANPLDLMRSKRSVIITTDTGLTGMSRLGGHNLNGKELFRVGGRPLEPGNIITYRLDDRRELYLLVCRILGDDNWTDAHRYIGLGLYYLWQRRRSAPRCSFVKVNCSAPLTVRARILLELMRSPLRCNLYSFNQEQEVAKNTQPPLPPLSPLRVWRINDGEHEVRLSSAA